MGKTILIAGATGYLGGHIIDALKARGDEYIALTTNAAKAANRLNGAKKIVEMKDILTLSGEKIDAVINLAGRNLAERRWNEKFKQDVLASRVDTLRALIELISKMPVKPEVLVSASGVDYYGEQGDKDVYENIPAADDYMGKLCEAWEAGALDAEKVGVRTVVLRTGFVMSADAVAVKKLTMPFKFFVGGPVGSGKQYISWIHLDDIVGLYLFAIDNINVRGVYNAAAPNPETMKDYCKHMAKAMHRPSLFPVPAFVVRIVAGEMAQVVLQGRRALPKKIMDAGYKFKYSYAAEAWEDIFE